MLKKLSSIAIMVILLVSCFSYPVSNAKAADPTTVKVGWTSEPDSISPFIAYSISATEIFKLIYDPLVTFDNDLKPVGRLAKDWSVSDDHLSWTFHLQEGVKWHDGEPFTAEDVKFTYETMQKSGLGLYAGYLDGITSIETPDDLTVVIKTKDPKANMLQSTTPILPKHIWKDVSMEDLKTWPNDSPVGTGAFQFDEFKKGEYIKLKRNDNYFYKKANIDELVFVLYANTDTMVQSLKIGEVDAAINIGANQVPLLKKEKNIDVVSTSTHGFTELSLNTWSDSKSKGNPLLLNKDVRHAISYAIDKQKIVDVAYAGQATPGTTLIPPSIDFWHYEPSKEEMRMYNPDKAKEILDAAGFKDTNGDGIREDSKGKPLKFRLMLRSKTSEEVRAGEMIGSMLEQVGIGTDIETVDDGLLGDRIYDNANFDMFIWGWGTDADPTTILRVMTTDQIGNLSDSYYSNKEYDQLLQEQAKIIDDNERQNVVYKMQKMLYDDAPYIILMYENAIQAVNTERLEGWTKVSGVYFYAFNNENYLNVKPVSATKPAKSKDSKESNAAAADDSSSSSSTLIWIGLIVVVLVIGGIIIARRKNKNVSIDDDM